MLLLDRLEERAVLDRALEGARSGLSAAIVVRGEAGIGKSALLSYAIEAAPDLTVVLVRGIESEKELGYAALHHLLVPLISRREELPPPQAHALGCAFGLVDGAAPSQFLVGLAALTLLAKAAEARPLLCVIDDAQWLDRESVDALAFVARRLYADRVALLFAVRDSNDGPPLLERVPELRVSGLPDADALELLSSVVDARLDRHVAQRIVEETTGNPLALVELSGELTAGHLAGRTPLPQPLPLGRRLEDRFLRQVRELPTDTQTVLLIAAADPTRDPRLLLLAAEYLQIDARAVDDAEDSGLFAPAPQSGFRHPLIRSAIYAGASPAQRRRAHEALAVVTDPVVDGDRRAWHLAGAAIGTDEDVARELERSANRAQSRGGLSAAAAFLRRAAELTPDARRRSHRALAAARAAHDAGSSEMALELLATIEPPLLEPLPHAQLELLRGRIAFALRRGSDAPPMLLHAAKRLEPLDAAVARETYLEALLAAMRVGALGDPQVAVDAATAARASSQPTATRAVDLLLDGLAARCTEGVDAGADSLARAFSMFAEDELSNEDGLRWLWVACTVAMELWNDDMWHALVERQVQHARDAGALTVLPLALNHLATLQVHSGAFDAAASLIHEADDITAATGNAPMSHALLVLTAWRGDEATASALIDAGIADAHARGEGMSEFNAELARALLFNSLGRYEEVLPGAERARVHAQHGFGSWLLPELIEAATRSGNFETANEAMGQLESRTRASGTDWARGIEARSRALVTPGAGAEHHYREALARLGRTRVAVHQARAHLLYGEWLRRAKRRVEARDHLRTAYEMFSTMGANAFGERARIELLATGERARKRTLDTTNDLTAQENQVARLAARGATNQEIASQLFISVSTVDYHLRKVYRKLGLSSRRALARSLSS